LPSNSKNSNFTEILYWVGATTCHTQFLFGGYSLGQPGVVMVPLSLVRSPPQAAERKEKKKGLVSSHSLLSTFLSIPKHLNITFISAPGFQNPESELSVP
jgi:hypothetical protein